MAFGDNLERVEIAGRGAFCLKFRIARDIMMVVMVKLLKSGCKLLRKKTAVSTPHLTADVWTFLSESPSDAYVPPREGACLWNGLCLMAALRQEVYVNLF